LQQSLVDRARGSDGHDLRPWRAVGPSPRRVRCPPSHGEDVLDTPRAEVKEEPIAATQLDHDSGPGQIAVGRERAAADERDPHLILAHRLDRGKVVVSGVRTDGAPCSTAGTASCSAHRCTGSRAAGSRAASGSFGTTVMSTVSIGAPFGRVLAHRSQRRCLARRTGASVAQPSRKYNPVGSLSASANWDDSRGRPEAHGAES
jgi:hypothetical protein